MPGGTAPFFSAASWWYGRHKEEDFQMFLRKKRKKFLHTARLGIIIFTAL